ncbi:DsbA family protein [Sphingomonas aracearum]|uniref:DsbA family protein n=1 Tax=Sphingomonas aracearum TaxID=2283317 RepID=A0A369VY29_9SPHN|nr:DsbA family protein [Sphingomonas aracearum]RDE06739.1 DsbA family protein [Sphingomonas aracearum]
MSRLTLPLAALAGLLIGGLAVYLFTTSRHGAPLGERARMEAVVRDYVLSHPELIPEAMQRLQDKQTGSAVALNRKAIQTPFGNAWAGNPRGDVTVVEYFDYNCGYCRASLPLVRQLIASDPNVKVVFREWPILAQSSVDAARLSLAAAEQGKFEAFHDALYNAGPVSPETMRAAAAKAGVDPAGVARLGDRADKEIALNRQVARDLGLNGTPSWVIGDKVVSSMLPLDKLQQLVAEARTK